MPGNESQVPNPGNQPIINEAMQSDAAGYPTDADVQPPAPEVMSGVTETQADDPRRRVLGGSAIRQLVTKVGVMVRGDTFYAPYEVKTDGGIETIDLVTPKHLAELPDGTEVISISGEKRVKGQDKLDNDTRGGFTSFGIPSAVPKHAENATHVYAGRKRNV